MAQQPCSNCNQPFRGEARNLYLSIYDHEAKVSFRHVVCVSCFDDLVSAWLQHALHRTPRGEWAMPEADETLDGLWTLVEGPQRPRFGQNGSQYLRYA